MNLASLARFAHVVCFFAHVVWRKNKTSAEPSDLLSSNMAPRNCLLGQSEFAFQILAVKLRLHHRNNRHTIRAPISCQSKNCPHNMADL